MKRFAIALIKLYQLTLGEFTRGSCRFYPSCSEYAIEAYQKKGFWMGSWLTFKRLVKCGPWHSGGHDDVP